MINTRSLHILLITRLSLIFTTSFAPSIFEKVESDTIQQLESAVSMIKAV